MNFLAATCRRRRTLGSFVTFSILLLGGREASADCVPTAANAGHMNAPGHFLESVPALTARSGCSRESASQHAIPALAATATTRLGAAIEASKWSLAGTRSAEQIATEHSPNVGSQTVVQQSLNGVHWADSRDWIHNPPEWLKEAKNYKRQGMPILHLMQSEDKSTLLSFGISNHGKPGLYLTRKLPF
jgi:hypothetical protein